MTDTDPAFSDDDLYALDMFDPDSATFTPGWEPPEVDPVDERRANAMLRKLRALRRRMVKDQVLADYQITETREWLSRRQSVLTPAINRLERSLDAFMRGWHEHNPKSKTLRLPAGDLKLSAPRDSLGAIDPDGFVKWATEHGYPQWIRTAPVPAVDKIKAMTSKGSKLPDITDGDKVIERWEARFTSEDGELVTLEGVEYRRAKNDSFKAVPAADD